GENDPTSLRSKLESAFKRLIPISLIGHNNHFLFACHGWLPFSAEQGKKEDLKNLLSDCSKSVAGACNQLSTTDGILNGRFLLVGEVAKDHDPRINIVDFTSDYLKNISSPECTLIALLCGHK